MFYPGTKAAAILTINSAFVAETNAHFLCQVNASSLLLNAGFKSKIISRASILVWDMQGLTVRPSRIVLDLPNNGLFIYFDGAVSTSVSLQYAICVSPLFAETDSASAFTNSNMSQYFGFNEAVGSTQTIDYVAGIVASSFNGGVIGTGLFGVGSAELGASSRFSTGINPILSDKSAYTVSLVVRPTSLTTNSQIIINNGASTYPFQIYKIGTLLAVYVGTTNFGTVPYATAGLVNDKTSFMTVVYDGSQPDNATRLKFYIDGIVHGLSFTGTIPATSPVDANALLNIGNVTTPNSFIGKIDEVSISTVARTIQGINSRYNMLFNASNFFTLGNPVISGVKRNSIHTGVSVSI